MDIYDKFVDVIEYGIDSVLVALNLQVIPFIKYCHAEVAHNDTWRQYYTLSGIYLQHLIEIVANADIVAVIVALGLITLLYIYRKYVLSYVHRHRGSGQEYKIEQYRQCEADLRQLMDDTNCNPIMLRLAWSDAATFDRTIRKWPDGGGCIGAVRFESIYDSPPNFGLSKAISMLTPIKLTYDADISWADLIQMAAAVAVEHAGGPKVTQYMRYGRVDATLQQVQRAGIDPTQLLPCYQAPYYDGTHSADTHIRNVFYNRMGFNSQEIVALMGAHTIGRAFKDRSGACPFSSGNQSTTEYTRESSVARSDGKPGIGMAGGCSWTVNWLTFDNSYFCTKRGVGADGSASIAPSVASTPASSKATTPTLIGPSSSSSTINTKDSSSHAASTTTTSSTPAAASLLWLPTDKALATSPEFSIHFKRYRDSNAMFQADYCKAHVKMSMLGAKLDPPKGFSIVEVVASTVAPAAAASTAATAT